VIGVADIVGKEQPLGQQVSTGHGLWRHPKGEIIYRADAPDSGRKRGEQGGGTPERVEAILPAESAGPELEPGDRLQAPSPGSGFDTAVPAVGDGRELDRLGRVHEELGAGEESVQFATGLEHITADAGAASQ
jgi:hypothetical protein